MSIEKAEWLQWYPGAIALAKQLLNGAEEAKDIVQNAYIKCFEHAHVPSEAPAQRVWLLTVVRNSCIDYLRSQKKFSAQDVEEGSSFSEAPQETFAQLQKKERIQTALKLLPTEMREILVLREMNELSYAEIAKLLSIENGTVMSRLHRARMALRDILHRLNEERGEI